MGDLPVGEWRRR